MTYMYDKICTGLLQTYMITTPLQYKNIAPKNACICIMICKLFHKNETGLSWYSTHSMVYVLLLYMRKCAWTLPSLIHMINTVQEFRKWKRSLAIDFSFYLFVCIHTHFLYVYLYVYDYNFLSMPYSQMKVQKMESLVYNYMHINLSSRDNQRCLYACGVKLDYRVFDLLVHQITKSINAIWWKLIKFITKQ